MTNGKETKTNKRIENASRAVESGNDLNSKSDLRANLQITGIVLGCDLAKSTVR